MLLFSGKPIFPFLLEILLQKKVIVCVLYCAIISQKSLIFIRFKVLPKIHTSLLRKHGGTITFYDFYSPGFKDLFWMEDRRRFARSLFREPVRFEYREGDVLQFGGCLGCDLSLNGMRMYFNDFVPLHTDMLLKFLIKKDCHVDVEARVIWAQKLPHDEKYQLGLKFTRPGSNFRPSDFLAVI